LVAATIFTCKPTGRNRKSANHLAEKKLKGKVNSITYYTCYADGDGNKVIRKALDEKYCEKYDDQGYMIAEVIYDNKTPNKIIDSFIYINNVAGKRIKAIRYNSDGSVYASYKYIYNSNGDLTEDNRWDMNGAIHTQNLYKYDDKVLVQHQRLIYGKVTNIEEYKHDSYGNIIEEVEYGKDLTVILGTKYYKYDTRGNKIAEYNRWSNGNEFKSEYEYDDEGDEAAMRIIDYDNKPSTTRFVYSDIDKQGNWHVKVTYNNDHPGMVYDRRITYYDK